MSDLILQERITRRINITSSGCWEWSGYRCANGYGKMSYLGRRAVWVHRMAYEAFNGPFTGDILHKCDNPPCANPDHLFLGDAKTNAADMMKKKRHPFYFEKIKTHCKRGHILDGNNLYIHKSTGRRQCLSCVKLIIKPVTEHTRALARIRSLKHYYKKRGLLESETSNISK